MKIPHKSVGALCIRIELHHLGHSIHRTARCAPGREAFPEHCRRCAVWRQRGQTTVITGSKRRKEAGKNDTPPLLQCSVWRTIVQSRFERLAYLCLPSSFPGLALSFLFCHLTFAVQFYVSPFFFVACLTFLMNEVFFQRILVFRPPCC